MNIYGITYPPELVTRLEAARLLSTSERGIAELATRGRLTPVDDGGKWIKFRLSEVRAYVASLPPTSPVDPPTYPPELLTRGDAAYLLSTSRRRVGELMQSGALKSVDLTFGGASATRVRLSDLRAFIASLSQ